LGKQKGTKKKGDLHLEKVFHQYSKKIKKRGAYTPCVQTVVLAPSLIYDSLLHTKYNIMKKILFFLLLFAIANSYSRPSVQATLKPGSDANTIEIWLKPSATFSQKDESMSLALAIPASLKTIPTLGSAGKTANSKGLVYGTSGLRPNFLINNLGATSREVVVTSEAINGAAHYVYTFLFAGTASSEHNWTAGEEQLIFRIAFEGCATNCNLKELKLVNLPKGGSTGNAYWYFQSNTLGDITNYVSPFYANSNTGALKNGGSTNGSALSVIGLADANQSPGKLNLINKVSVYPTLTNGPVTVQLPADVEGSRISVMNAAGEEVAVDENKNGTRQLNLKGFAAGSYMIKVISSGKIINSTTVVVHK
jgi:hypothetical protein